MAIRLGDHVVYGYIDNRIPNTTRGTLHLHCSEGDGPVDVRFELSGNCDADLRGKYVRFWCACDPWECAPFDREKHKGFQWLQIGPTGDMTASGWVRKIPCSTEEFLRRSKLGETPPTPWVRHLYLEWHSQNGRVVVEMADPLVEWRPDEPKETNRPLEPCPLWLPLPNLAVMPECARKDAPPLGLDITKISLDGDTPLIEHWTACARHKRDKARCEKLDEYFEQEAFPLESTLDEDIDWDEFSELCEEDEDTAAFMEETERMDRCLEEKGKPLFDIFAGKKPPAEHTLDDASVDSQLKVLLAQLALANIALDICPHFSPRDTYRILTEKILPEEEFHPEMVGTGWVQHFCTYEDCPECQADLNYDIQENEHNSEDYPEPPF